MSASPVLSYSTYFGGAGFDAITAIAVDGGGNVYLAGYTNSSGLPNSGTVLSALNGSLCGDGVTTYACFDAFVAKIDPTGQRVIYIAYLGGSGDEYATGIAVDSAGAAYITGYTDSPDLPTRNAAQPVPGGGACGAAAQPTNCFDSFVAKLDPLGSEWTFVTYLGGSGDDFAQSIAVDAAGGVAITGTTMSLDFPIHNALQSNWGGGANDGFVAKLDPNSAGLSFSTYLGGSGDDFGTSIAMGSEGSVYLAGYTNSADLSSTGGPQTAYSGGTCGALSSTFPCYDAYAAKLSSAGTAIEYLTHLGGTGGDYAYGIAVDAAGSATIAGMTTSQDFPTTFGAFQLSGGGNNTDAFVARLNPEGTSFIYSTYLGGLGAEAATAISVDADGRAVVSGYSYGPSFPNVFRLGSGGFHDFFLAVIASDGSALDLSASLGGTGQEKARAVAIDQLGNAYVAGETFSIDYPMSNALQAAYAGGAFEGAVTKLALGSEPFLYASPNQIDFGEQRVASASEPHAVTLTNIGGGELVFKSFEIEGNFEIAANSCDSVAPGSSCGVSLAFLPSTVGLRMGSLTVRTHGSEGTTRIELTGVGIAPEARISVTSVVYESQLVGTESGPEEITLSNTGTAFLEFAGISLSGEFKQSNDCPASIPAGGSCTISIAFIPRTSGEQSGNLVVIDDLPVGSKQISLSGRGTDFALTASHGDTALKAGEQATYRLAVSPVGGFSGSVSLACAGAPKGAACSISPSLIRLEGSNPADASVTVSTTAGARVFMPPAGSGLPSRLELLLMAAFCVVLSSSPIFRTPQRRIPLVSSCALALVLASAVLLAACGGGGLPKSLTPSSGTPPGTYTLQVKGTVDGVTRSTEFALVVR